MRYVVLTRAPAFALEGTVHRVCPDPVPVADSGRHLVVGTVCGLTLENTEEAATVVLNERPRRKALPYCQRCRR